MEEESKNSHNFQKQFEETNSKTEKEERELDVFRKEIKELSRKDIRFFNERFDENDLNADDMKVYRMFQQGGRVFSIGEALERLNSLKGSSSATPSSKMLAEYIYETTRERMLSKL